MATEKIITEEMREYAKEQMIQLLKNLSHEPIECYSVKEPGKEKQFFLGYNYVEKLIDRIKGQPG